MPLYEYRCKECDATFEVRRSMSESSNPAPCPEGHANTVKLLSAFASVGVSSGSYGAAPSPSPAPRTGGGCGGGCACAH
ncbi:MAG: FmdB family zinc ribbon protein [Ilumatobacteraceae bacterium]